MILHSLYKLYERMAADDEFNENLPMIGFSLQKISFFIILTPDGILYDIQDARLTKTVHGRGANAEERTVCVPRSIIVPGGAHPSGSSASPRFLWDSSAYLLGYYTDEAKKNENDKIKARDILFPAYRDYHRRFMEEHKISDPGMNAVVKFLESWNPYAITDEVMEKLNAFGNNFGVFKLQNESKCVFESDEILNAWKSKRVDSDLPHGMCLVTGAKDVEVVPTIGTKIKLPGTSVGGGAISSFNANAYESYGKKQTLNAPISEEAGFKACNALNILIDDNRYHFKLADTTVVFWTEKKTVTEDLLALVLDPSDDDCAAQDQALALKIKTFWNVVAKTGNPDLTELGDESETPFYMLGIEPNSARIVVRFWRESTLGDIVLRLRKHHAAMAVQKVFDTDPDHIPLWQILAQTARDSKGIPPLLGAAVLRSVLCGTPYPASMYQLVLNRIHVAHDDYKVGRKVSYVQASIVKAFLTRNKNKGGLAMSLNIENKDPAYLLGRLFATLEKTQDEASDGVNAGVADKFYSSASATPRIVFPTLLDLFRKHLKKLSSTNSGLAVIRDKLVGEILDAIDSKKGFPSNLSLEERGLFALGYYQQMRSFFTKKTDSENK